MHKSSIIVWDFSTVMMCYKLSSIGQAVGSDSSTGGPKSKRVGGWAPPRHLSPLIVTINHWVTCDKHIEGTARFRTPMNSLYQIHRTSELSCHPLVERISLYFGRYRGASVHLCSRVAGSLERSDGTCRKFVCHMGNGFVWVCSVVLNDCVWHGHHTAAVAALLSWLTTITTLYLDSVRLSALSACLSRDFILW